MKPTFGLNVNIFRPSNLLHMVFKLIEEAYLACRTCPSCVLKTPLLAQERRL